MTSPSSDNNFKQGMIEALNYLQIEIDKDGWDQPARLFELETMQLDPDDVEKGWLVGCNEIIEGGITDHPPTALDEMAAVTLESIASENPIVPRSNVMGFLLATEGWGVVGEPHQSMDEIFAGTPTGRLKDHPNAVEVRTLAVVDIAGNWCIGNWYRDEDKLIAEGKKLPFSRSDAPVGEERFNSSFDGLKAEQMGAVLNSLKNFVAAFHLANSFALITAKKDKSE